MPDVPGRPQHNPMCVDETMMQWLNATRAGKKPNIDRVGLSYMLKGEARQGQGGIGSFVSTTTIIPFFPDGWAASAGGFPAMKENVAFLMKDFVSLLCLSTC
jgi:hypothetical protein